MLVYYGVQYNTRKTIGKFCFTFSHLVMLKCLNLFFRSVFDQSNELCKTRYQKPAFKEDQTFLDKLQKGNITHFNAKQKYAFRGIFSWRNAIARQEDESEHYV